jgi:glucose-1-phosphate thymidylyltransferase
MIYYPLSTLMLAGIKDILIISTPDDTPRFEVLLGDGSQYGINLSYKVQPSPDGLAQAFILGEQFLNGEAGAMVLGDNIFYGNGFRTMLKAAVKDAEENGRATVFGYYVPDPERFGVVAFDEVGRATSIEEKPKEPKSNLAVPPFYYYLAEDIKRIPAALEAGCGYDAPGSFAAWLSSQTTMKAYRMPGSRYDIGNLESYEKIKASYKGVVK